MIDAINLFSVGDTNLNFILFSFPWNKENLMKLKCDARLRQVLGNNYYWKFDAPFVTFQLCFYFGGVACEIENWQLSSLREAKSGQIFSSVL